MKVQIFNPARSTMQSGLAKTQQWVIEYEALSGRNPEPLMGWSSSEDTLNQVRIKFPSKEAAIAHAEREGWEYSIAINQQRKVKPRNYGDNFRYIPPADR